mmetsp:Transcript_11426/g.25990  ORF Transcript_11426/g.25990 Transcript_11426/m.25990 type:complete len:215 (-) Transcript_11426:654-1298(-)
MHTVVAVDVLARILGSFSLFLLLLHFLHKLVEVEPALKLLLIVHVIDLAVCIDLHAGLFQVTDVVLFDLTELRPLVCDRRVLPSDLLRLGVEVVAALQVLVVVLLPSLRQLHSNVRRLDLLDVVVDVQSHLVPLRVLVPLHYDALLSVQPLGGLALQPADVDTGRIWNLALRHLLLVVGVALLHGGVHEILFTELHHYRVVAPALELHLISIHV